MLDVDVESKMYDVLCDSNYMSEYWVEYWELVSAEKKKISKEEYRNIPAVSVEDRLFNGLKKGYLLLVKPYEDKPVYLSYGQFFDTVRANYDKLENDEIDADSVFQTACFGEIVYG